jgi:hypothetical protein
MTISMRYDGGTDAYSNEGLEIWLIMEIWKTIEVEILRQN